MQPVRDRTRQQSQLRDADEFIRRRISSLGKDSKDFWDFKTGGRSGYDDSPFQYPAMMVPALQRELMNIILEAQPTIQTIADPFVGSGTVLCESMLAGRQFVGQDINPLAVLISRMRLESLNESEIKAASSEVIDLAKKDTSTAYDVGFFNQKKWFSKGVNIALSRLRRAIVRQPNYGARLFLWIALAETIRSRFYFRSHCCGGEPCDCCRAYAEIGRAAESELSLFGIVVRCVILFVNPPPNAPAIQHDRSKKYEI